ncbi:MAG: hypothetical protein ABII64_06350 [Elusimicrobiota bacterium]
MKKNVTDAQQLNGFKEKISAWLKGLTGGHGEEFISGLEIIEAVEYEVRRIYYEVQIETRGIAPFTKKEKAPDLPKAVVFDPKTVDIWAVKVDEASDFSAKSVTIEIPESLKAVNCAQCSGTGQSVCQECMGHKGVHCPACRGDGKIKCANCRGSKSILCEQCGGTGQMDGGTGGCPRCGGKKEYKCPVCEGRGVVPCGTCGGKMRLPCKKCEETGSVSCGSCNGAGQSISGYALEVHHITEFRKAELMGSGIPQDIFSKLQQNQIEWKREFESDSAGLAGKGLDKEFLDTVGQLGKKISVPQNGKLLFDRITAERSAYIKVLYKIPGTSAEVWFSGKDMKLTSEQNPLTSAYAGLTAEIKRKISKLEFAESEILLQKIAHIDFLKSEIGLLRQKAKSARLALGVRSGLAGSVVFSLIVLPIIYSLLAKSFHAGLIIAAALILNLIIGFTAGYLQYLSGIIPSGNLIKKTFITGSVVAAFLSVIYSFAPITNFNPAKALDKSRMLEEYQKYFPYGLTTLANEKDIQFLEYLTIKYARTGVDVSQQKKELEWLKAKLIEDKKNLEQSEKQRQELENAAKGKNAKRKVILNKKKAGSNIRIKKVK